MYKKANFLVAISLLCLAVVGSHAQVVGKDPSVEAAQLQGVIARAIDTTVIQDGKIRSFKLSLPNDRERLLFIEHSEDGKSFTIVDEGRKTVVVLDELRRISEIVFPNGKKAGFEWAMAPSGQWMPSSVKVAGRNLCSTAGLVNDDCRDLCERAAVLAAIAAATCTASGPWSAACWSATSSAAVVAYYCYRCLNPEPEAPPEN